MMDWVSRDDRQRSDALKKLGTKDKSVMGLFFYCPETMERVRGVKGGF